MAISQLRTARGQYQQRKVQLSLRCRPQLQVAVKVAGQQLGHVSESETDPQNETATESERQADPLHLVRRHIPKGTEYPSVF